MISIGLWSVGRGRLGREALAGVWAAVGPRASALWAGAVSEFEAWASARPRPVRAWRPAVEVVEARALRAAAGSDYVFNGFTWADPSLITYSVAPDGVAWGHGVNDLNAVMDARFGAGVWERELARALATWESVAALNVAPAADGPYDMNTPGRSQGDPRFGDVRFGGYAFPDAPTVLAQSFFPPPDGGTESGDVEVNTAMPWSIGGDHDLFSVMLHETGLTLGLGEPPAPSVVMNHTYGGVRTGLTDGDVAGIQALYGPRVADAFQAAGQGVSFGSAVDLTAALDGRGQADEAGVSLATAGDTEYFTFVAPAGASGGLAVTAAAGGVSMLSPSVTLFDASGHALDAAADPAAWSDDVTAHATGVVPGQRYYAAVTGATADAFAVGAYHLRVAFTTAAPPPAAPVAVPTPAPVSTPAPVPVAASANTTFGSAQALGPVTATFLPGPLLDGAGDPAFYSVQTTRAGDYWVGAPGATVRLFDARGRQLSAGPNLVALGVDSAPTTLYVEVSAGASTPPPNGLAVASFPAGTGPSFLPRPAPVFSALQVAEAPAPAADAHPWVHARARRRAARHPAP